METRLYLLKLERDLNHLFKGLDLTLKSGLRLSWSLGSAPFKLLKVVTLFVFKGPRLVKKIKPGAYENVEYNKNMGQYGHFTHPPSSLL